MKKEQNQEHEDILAEARERYAEAIRSDRDNREEALDDLEFLVGRQWPESVKATLTAASRPMLTINRMPQFLRQVTGDIRRTNPAIKILAANSEATTEIAEVYSGLIRNIEQTDDAQSTYEQAAEQAAACGMGHWRILTEYEDERSFNQEIHIKHIPNPFAVNWDPMAKDPTRKDAKYCLITESMSEDEFDALYPSADKTSWNSGEMTDAIRNWFNGDDVTVAEYFWIEEEQQKIYQLEGGQVVDALPDGVEAIAERETTVRKVKWAKLTAGEILEGPFDIAGKYIPVVTVVGEELAIGDRTVRSSVIRYAKDAQRMYNYWRSAQTEIVALQPKAPYIMTPKQAAGLESQWATANTNNKAFLLFNPDSQNPGPPKRETPPVASSGMMQEIQAAAEDMKATTGIYDAGLGNRSNEQSGVAIRQRQLESDMSTSIYADNLAKSIGHCGRIIVDMIPNVYDTKRALRLIGEDKSAEMVEVNGITTNEDGEVQILNLALGRYDVRVSTGPSYSTQRQETVENIMEFVKAFPAAAPVVGDLIARNMDWPGADDLADRLKKMLPPGIAKPDPNEKPTPPDPAQIRAQQLQEAAQETELRKAGAMAAKAEADAKKSQADALSAELELAVQSGQMDAAIQEAVARALGNLTGPIPQDQGPIAQPGVF